VKSGGQKRIGLILCGLGAEKNCLDQHQHITFDSSQQNHRRNAHVRVSLEVG
jgi:hypothetical protein